MFLRGRRGTQEEAAISVFVAPPELCRREVEAQPNLPGRVMAMMPVRSSRNPFLPSLLSFRDGNSGKQQGFDVQVGQAVGPGGAGGKDPGRHQQASRLLRELLLSELPALQRHCLPPLQTLTSVFIPVFRLEFSRASCLHF